MDIDLLAKMVGELILEHDEVALPGVGTFVAELVGASFSDKGFTINPPYRKLSFRQREGDGSLLTEFYARTNSLEKSTAEDILTRFLSEMKEILKTRKYIVFPGLGRLRATRENLFFFVPDEDLNIYPEGFGLERVSLKSHEELEEVTELSETAAAVAAIQGAPADLPGAKTPDFAPPAAENALPGAKTPDFAPPAAENAQPGANTPIFAPPTEEIAPPADKTAVSPAIPPVETVAETPETVAETSETAAAASEAPAAPATAAASKSFAYLDEYDTSRFRRRRRRPIPVWLMVLLNVLAVAAAVLLLLAILGRVAPEFVDRFLYTPEELEILYR